MLEKILFKLLINWIWVLIALIIFIVSVYSKTFELIYMSALLIILILIFGKKYYKGFDLDGNTSDNSGFLNGFDALGYDKEEYNQNGYDMFGYDKYGFDSSGYDKDGFNSLGVNRRNETKVEQSIREDKENSKKRDADTKIILKEIEKINNDIAKYKQKLSYINIKEEKIKYTNKLITLESKLNTLNSKLFVLTR